MWRRVARRSRRPHLGLALSGGAARGIAHVGVLKVFEEHGVAVDCVAGTSAGALVGGALAAGMTVEEIEKIARTMRWRDLGRMTLSRLGFESLAFIGRRSRLGRLLHSARRRLDLRAAFQPFQAGDFLALLTYRAFELGDFAQ